MERKPIAKGSLYKEEEELHQGLEPCVQKGQLEIMCELEINCMKEDEEVHQLITQSPLDGTAWM